jgi:hypothetical protein
LDLSGWELNKERRVGMKRYSGDEVEGVRRIQAAARGTAAGEAADGRIRVVDPGAPVRLPEASSDRDTGPVLERLESLEQRIGGDVARLREAIEIHSLSLFGKAIEAMSSLEADWVRAHAEADSWREKWRQATLGIGELQQQLDRIAELRRRAESESAADRDELLRELARAREAQREACEQRDAALRECLQLQRRLSWRVTAPLRFVRSLLPKIRR